jgi:hypothetical protein
MTRDQILSMKPGPELDGLIAERVMGLCVHVLAWDHVGDGKIWFRCSKCKSGDFDSIRHREGPSKPQAYSTTFAAAAQVLDRFAVPNNPHAPCLSSSIVYPPEREPYRRWLASMDGLHYAPAREIAHAIALAALLTTIGE